MKEVPVFLVDKFLPPACPNCARPFAEPSDYVLWGGSFGGKSFAEALTRQARSFPELYSVQESGRSTGVTNRFSADFILCTHCENKTFRIHYGQEQVLSRDEADRLVSEAGFTSITEGRAFGTHAVRMSTIFFIGAADLDRLNTAVTAARSGAAGAGSAGGDVFASLFDPALQDMARRLHEQNAPAATRVHLSERFGGSWDRLGTECQHFLATAEILRSDLRRYSETDPDIDFSPVVMAYSKALERELLDSVFSVFALARDHHTLPEPTGDEALDRSVAALQQFLTDGRTLSLGEMSYCLKNVGCRGRAIPRNGFAAFLGETHNSLDVFCDELKFPQRLNKYVAKYRNAAAHVARLTADDCEAARAYLLDEPVQLLIALVRSEDVQ